LKLIELSCISQQAPENELQGIMEELPHKGKKELQTAYMPYSKVLYPQTGRSVSSSMTLKHYS
jgi:hypothetical protein